MAQLDISGILKRHHAQAKQERPGASNELRRMRTSAGLQAGIYRAFRKAVQALYSADYPLAERNYRLAQEVDKAQAALDGLMEILRSDKADIEERAARQRVAATPEARAKVERALAMPGFAGDEGLNALCELLTEEGDRAGLQALREYLPYAARDGRLAVPGGVNGRDYRAIVKYAEQNYLDRNEAKLHKKTEAEAHAELREVEISWAYIEQNHTQLTQTFANQVTYAQTGPVQETLDTLTRWQGLPDDNQPKGLIRLDVDADAAEPETVERAQGAQDGTLYFH